MYSKDELGENILRTLGARNYVQPLKLIDCRNGIARAEGSNTGSNILHIETVIQKPRPGSEIKQQNKGGRAYVSQVFLSEDALARLEAGLRAQRQQQVLGQKTEMLPFVGLPRAAQLERRPPEFALENDGKFSAETGPAPAPPPSQKEALQFAPRRTACRRNVCLSIGVFLTCVGAMLIAHQYLERLSVATDFGAIRSEVIDLLTMPTANVDLNFKAGQVEDQAFGSPSPKSKTEAPADPTASLRDALPGRYIIEAPESAKSDQTALHPKAGVIPDQADLGGMSDQVTSHPVVGDMPDQSEVSPPIATIAPVKPARSRSRDAHKPRPTMSRTRKLVDHPIS